MEAIPAILSAIFALSAAANVVLLISLRASRKKPRPSITAENLMHDLTRGQAVIRIEVIDPSAILLRSPKI